MAHPPPKRRLSPLGDRSDRRTGHNGHPHQSSGKGRGQQQVEDQRRAGEQTSRREKLHVASSDHPGGKGSGAQPEQARGAGQGEAKGGKGKRAIQETGGGPDDEDGSESEREAIVDPQGPQILPGGRQKQGRTGRQAADLEQNSKLRQGTASTG